MNDITYRILSFIFYSCVYYCEKLGYLSNNDIQTFFFINGNEHNNNIFFILRKIWEILIEELIKREVNNIQCFLNMVIPELSKLIFTSQKSMNNPNERNEFEILCNKIKENTILNYKKYYKTYINNNKEILEIQDNNIKSILQETSENNNLTEIEFPLIKYFYASNYPNYKNFIEEFNMIPNNFKQYPVPLII